MILFTYFLILLFAYLISFFTGHILLSPLKRDSAFSNLAWLFFKLLTGFITCTIIFACIKTNFSTVYINILPLLLIGCLYLKKTNSLKWNKQICLRLRQIEYKELLASVGIIILIFFLQYNELFNFTGAPLSVDKDIAFYAQIGTSINQSGIETLVLDTINQSNYLPTFYHYFEIWFGVLFSDLFGQNILYGLILVSYAFMLILIIIGSAAVLQQSFNVSLYKALLFSLPLLFMGYFRRIHGDETIFTTFTQVLSTLRIQKLCLVYISFLLFLILWKKKNLFARIFPFCLMFLLYGTTLPAVVLGTCLYLLSLILTKQEKSKPDILFSFLALIVPAIGIVLFYFFTSTSGKISDYQLDKSNLIQGSWNHYVMQTSILFLKKIVVYSIHTIIPLLFILPIFIKEKRSLKRIWNDYALPFFILLGGLYLYCLTLNRIDGFQLFTNIFIPFISLLVFFVVSLLIFSNSRIQHVLAILIICFQFFANFTFHSSQPINQQYYEEIANSMKKGNNKLAYIFDDNTIKNNPNVRNANVIYINNNLTRYTNHYIPAFLNSFELLKYSHLKNEDTLYIKNSVIQSPFYQYVTKEKMYNTTDKPIPEYQYEFIKKNNIRFLITDKNSQWLTQSPFKVKRVIESGNEPFWFVEIY